MDNPAQAADNKANMGLAARVVIRARWAMEVDLEADGAGAGDGKKATGFMFWSRCNFYNALCSILGRFGLVEFNV